VITTAARRRVSDLGAASDDRLAPLAARGRRLSAGRLVAGWSAALGIRGSDDADHAALLEAVARSLRGGASLVQALGEGAASVPPCLAAQQLRVALSLHERGAPVGAVIETWSAGASTAARSVASAALALGSDLGGARAQALDGAAASLRDRSELLREVRALTSQARSSAAVMILAPIGFSLYAWTTDRRVAGLMFTTPAGWACLVGGLVLDALGGWWMARLTTRVA
jgi:tight adherence protein B